jgi:ComF family protein
MAQSYSFKTNLYTLLRDFMALLYPEICIGCEGALGRKEDLVCFECSIDMPVTNFAKEKDNPVERLFWFKTNIEEAMACYFFTKKSPIQKMIHSFKYKGNEESAVFLGRKLGEALLTSGRFKTLTQIIPVPLHPDKFKIRGYNQAQKIAMGISEVLNIPVNTTSLARVSHNETQTNKGLFSRWENVETIFKLQDSSQVMDAHVLIVDDVITSGSTIEAFANQILSAEGAKVSLAALAIATG